MDRIAILCLLIVGQVKVVLSVCDSATYTSERAANAVQMKFYRVQTGKWTDEGNSNKIAAQVINFANSYCASNAGTCGLENCCSSAFKEDLVVVASGYPENKLKDLLIKISLDLPTGLNSSGSPECVVGKSALQTIIERAREDIHNDAGYWITYIDDEFFGIPPPTDLNKIIIPIAFAVIIGLAILTLILNFWNKRREESLRRKKIIEQRKKSKLAKESPVYNVDTKVPRPPSGVGAKNQNQSKPKREVDNGEPSYGETIVKKSTVRKDQLYKDKLRQSNLSAKKTASIASEDSAIRVDTDTRHRQAFSYEKQLDGASGYESMERKGYGGYSEPEAPPASHLKPIESGADDDIRSPEKKKKKKKKRSKSKEVMDGPTNDGYTNADFAAGRTNVWSYSLN